MDWLTERFGALGAEAMVLVALWIVACTWSYILRHQLDREARAYFGIPFQRLGIRHFQEIQLYPALVRFVERRVRMYRPVLYLAVSPVGEEVFYRGAVLLLGAWYPQATLAIVLLCAAAFTFSHVNAVKVRDAMGQEVGMTMRARLAMIVANITIVFVFGVLAGYLVLHTQSLYLVAFMHALWNFFGLYAIDCIRLCFAVVEYARYPRATMRELRLWLQEKRRAVRKHLRSLRPPPQSGLPHAVNLLPRE